MIHLVYGGSSCGKSEYAENLAMSLGDNRYYIATMAAYTKEDMHRVNKHRNLRQGKNFETIELPTDVNKAVNIIENDNDRLAEDKSVVLLECMSNLVANEMFVKDGEEYKLVAADVVTSKVIEDIKVIAECKNISHLIIVSNNVFEGGTNVDGTTLSYMKALGDINILLADVATDVTEVVCGIPIKLK